MSEDQSITEVEARPEDEQEILEFEGEAKVEPKHDGVPLATFVQMKKEKQAAQKQLDEQARQMEAMKQQNELLALSGTPKVQTVARPNPDDFYDDPAGFNAAMDAYETHLVKRSTDEAQKLIDNKFQSLDQQESVKQAQQKQQESINAHYERAQTLNAADFLEVEEKVRGEIDEELYTLVTGYFDNSEHVIYSLGGDLSKAAEFQKLIKSDPIRGFQKLIRYADSLDTKLETKTLPEPDVAIKGGLSGASNVAAKVEKLRALKTAGKLTMSDFMRQKRELEAS